MKAYAWLFGLAGEVSQRLDTPCAVIRCMTESEANRVLHASQDFFAKDVTIWVNTIKRFPFVCEKAVSPHAPIGGDESVAFILSLLSPGEIRAPVQWHIGDQSSGGSSASDVIEYFFRLINGRYQPVKFEDIEGSALTAILKLQKLVESSPASHGVDPVLVERLYASKRHVLGPDAPKANIVGRSADVSVGLEYLLNEGTTSEIQFRLALSLAWLLETTVEKREEVIGQVREVYEMRSKHLHGARMTPKSLSKVSVETVLIADRLFRRALLARIISSLDDNSWTDLIRRSRLGDSLPIDQVQWLAT